MVTSDPNPGTVSRSSVASSSRRVPFLVALTGNPNCGKTTVFNALTGLRAKVGNYAGVTVERKEGSMVGVEGDRRITILDLPGTYSLSPQSPDEQIARDVLFGRVAEVPNLDLVVVVLDASNLQRNLYYATQVIELGYPTFIALNMMDVARENGHDIEPEQLSKALGAPVFPLVASEGSGVRDLRRAIEHLANRETGSLPEIAPREFCELPQEFGREAENIESLLETQFPNRRRFAVAEALLILSDDKVLASRPDLYPSPVVGAVSEARARLTSAGVDWRSAAIEARYARAAAIAMAVTTETALPGETHSDRLDRILTHRVYGLVIFVAIMGLVFQSIFAFAQWPMHGIEYLVELTASHVETWMPAGDLNRLIVQGVIAGVGAVIVFLPQICLLFFFISLLEDTGYMARAAFLMDRLMSRVGLHGKSFIPMLSSFACAIPGIMATRTIESPRDRLVTILVAPLMSCSARLPVYTLLIAACIPTSRKFLGIFGLPGLTLLSMYLLGIFGALGMAWLFKRTLLRGEPPPLILELPPYKRPILRVILRHMWDRSRLFIRRAGTVILGINILLWFLATYPKQSVTASSGGDQLRESYAGKIGHLIEPVIRPLGFDWKIGIGIVASFAAREVFVSTMSVVYNVEDAGDEATQTKTLAEVLQRERHPSGAAVYTTLTGITLMVFYVFAMQCASTVVIVYRETNSWKWPLFQWVYMTALAWIMAFICYQGGRLLGLG